MIDFIKGTVNDLQEDYIVVENNNKGYIIYMANKDISELKIAEDVKIYTRLIVREDSLSIYGFLQRDARTLFDLLTSVSGVGPKVARGIISSLTTQNIISAINLSDDKTLTKAPGIGKKTAARIILELKDKVSKYSFNVDIINQLEDENLGENESPAIEALISLGYNKFEAKSALAGVDPKLELSQLIKAALKNMGR